MRPRCPSVGPEGYRCRKRVHGPVPADPTPPLEVCHVAYGWPGEMYWDDETASSAALRQTVSVGDEEIVWDVARLIERAQAREVGLAPVSMYVEPEAVTAHHWRSVDIHTPIILIPHPHTGRSVVVDGRHRLYKAWKQNRLTVPAVLLTRADEVACRISPEEQESAWARELTSL